MNSFSDELKIDTKKYKSIPFWSWNDRLEKEELIRQIDWMKQNGIGGFFMHARSGLRTEYMSEEWMECVRICIDHAKKIGLQAWLYDENGWPSGFAGGKLLEDDQNHDKYLTYTIGKYEAEALVSYIIKEDELIRTNKNITGEEYLNVFEKLSTSTADILNPDVVKKFIELTHEEYKKQLGSNLFGEIKGFFSDEPQYYRWNLPYTDMVKEYFSSTYGEDILDGIGLLILKKKGYRRFRYMYWTAMQKLLLDNFAKTVYNWCETNGKQFTGHYIEEVSLGYQMLCCGGIMPFYEYEHIPGIDWLSRLCDSPISMKQVSSVAAQLGKKQILCEMYAGCGWDITPRELKRITEYMYINGINLTCQHLLPYSEKGNRIHDYPAHYSDINPWVRENFKEFNDYFTNLGALLCESAINPDVAVLQPIRSAYFDYDRSLEKEGFGVVELDNKYSELLLKLESSGVDYHLLDETLLAKYCRVEDTSIICGECVYKVLILPYCVTMDSSTEKILKKYVANGGKVYLFDGKPQFIEWIPFDYEYLYSNISWNEILDLRKFPFKHKGGRLVMKNCKKADKEFIFAMNHSLSDQCLVEFDLSDKYKSFESISLINNKRKLISSKFVLEPGESLVLIPIDKQIEETNFEVVIPSGDYRLIDYEDNYIVLDTLSLSKNGQNYGEVLSIPKAFMELLTERFEGKLKLKYSFEIREIPEKLTVEINADAPENIYVNGVRTTKEQILHFIKVGINDIEIEINYFQNQNVYDVFFGEDVTESMKNCLVYDTELTPLILKGKFGVYEKNGFKSESNALYGKDFYISNLPEKIDGLVKCGFPFFAGKIRLAGKFECSGNKTVMKLLGRWHVAEISINSNKVPKLFLSNSTDISEFVKSGENEFEVVFTIGNRNLYGPHHFSDEADPIMQGIEHFEFFSLDNPEIREKYCDTMSFIEAIY